MKIRGNTQIIDGTILNAQIGASAGIVYSKLNLTGGIVNADINASAAIAYSKLALTGSIVNADVSASAAIAYSKLALTNSIVSGDIVSLAGSKVTGAYTAAGLTLATSRLLGRTTASSGAAEEISVAGSLTLFGGVLTGTGSIVTPAALTKTDDTNVTLTLGGTPATALLQATSLTLGWTGTLAVARGGIGVGTLASNGVLYGNGTSAVQALAVNATATKKFLTQTSSAAPAWDTIAVADVPTLNQNTTGNAATATALQNTRTLWGQNFDGTGNVTGSLTAVADITGGASSMTVTAGTGASRTLTFKTTTAGSAATTALTLAADQSATFANTVNATTFVGALTGNASTATALQTARNINGVAFDGTANITVTAAAGTLTGTTLNATVVTSSLTAVGTIATGVWNGTIITPAYGGTGFDSSGVAKGGLIVGTAAGTFGLKAVGSDGQVLQADSASTGGVKWVTTSLVTPAALTRVDDTNVTLTLGGTPATALLQATSLTLGWTGTLAIARGGTGAGTATAAFDALSPMTALGDLIYGGASGTRTRLAGNTTTTKKWLNQSGDGVDSAAPTWTAITAADVTSGAALTRVNDTNVTLTLGGTPAAALLVAASLTLGWSGQLALSRGGTNANLSAVNGGIVWSDASALAITAAGTSGQILKSAGAAAPTWNTAGALTKTDDTNVTLALGGSHATALVNAASLTLGWTGTLAPARGGVGADVSGVAKGGLIVGTAAGTFGIKAVGTDGNVLIADSSVAGGVKWGSAGSGTVTGSGTTGAIPKWSSSSALADSIMTEASGIITITSSSDSPQGSRLKNVNTGTSAYSVLQFENNSGYSAAVFLNSSNNTNYTGAGSFTIGTLSATSVGLLTNNAVRLTIDSAGRFGINGTPASNTALDIATTTAGTNQWSVYSHNTIASGGTGTQISYYSAPSTAAASFTAASVSGFRHDNVTLGSGSAVTLQHGVWITDLTSGGSNYGYRGQVSAGSSKYNLYMDGTALNYLAGNTGVGTANPGTVNGIDLSSNAVLHVLHGSSIARLAATGSGAGTLELIDSAASANLKWSNLASFSGTFKIRSVNDSGSVTHTHLSGDNSTGTVLIADSALSVTAAGVLTLPNTSITHLMYGYLSVNVAGTSSGGFADAFKVAGWDGLGYDTSTGLVLGGYRSSQWQSIKLYTNAVLAMTINSDGAVISGSPAGAGTPGVGVVRAEALQCDNLMLNLGGTYSTGLTTTVFVAGTGTLHFQDGVLYSIT